MPELPELYVNIEDERWVKADLASMANTAFRAVLVRFELPLEGSEISLLGCDDARISVLNADFRQKPQATNVLSWPAVDYPRHPGEFPTRPEHITDDFPLELGDIAIAYGVCAHEAREQGKAFEAHVTHLLIHGCLHLLGFDHIDDKDATLMEGLEVEILGKLGYSDPYRVMDG